MKHFDCKNRQVPLKGGKNMCDFLFSEQNLKWLHHKNIKSPILFQKQTISNEQASPAEHSNKNQNGSEENLKLRALQLNFSIVKRFYRDPML